MYNKEYIQEMIELNAGENDFGVDEVVKILEQTFQECAVLQYGPMCDITARLNRKTYNIELTRLVVVVENISDYYTEITWQQAKLIDEKAEIGQTVVELLPQLDFSAHNILAIRRTFAKHMRVLEREKEEDYFQKHLHTIMIGTVYKIKTINMVVESVIFDINGSKVFMKKSGMVPNECFVLHTRVQVYIESVEKSHDERMQVVVSRAHPMFVVALFEQYVKEIEDKLVRIEGAARIPGVRTKIAVSAASDGINPVTTCIGIGCSRIFSVIRDMQMYFPSNTKTITRPEKIDLVQFTNNIGQYIAALIATSDNKVVVTKVILYSSMPKAIVVVPKLQINMAIGKNGNNVILAKQLSGYTLALISEEEHMASEILAKTARTQYLQNIIGCTDTIASILIKMGFSSPRDLLSASASDISKMTGFDIGQINNIRQIMKSYTQQIHQKLIEKIDNKELDGRILDLNWPMLDMILELYDQGISTIAQIAECPSKEFSDLLHKYYIDYEDADIILFAAKKIHFDDIEELEAPSDDFSYAEEIKE